MWGAFRTHSRSFRVWGAHSNVLRRECICNNFGDFIVSVTNDGFTGKEDGLVCHNEHEQARGSKRYIV